MKLKTKTTVKNFIPHCYAEYYGIHKDCTTNIYDFDKQKSIAYLNFIKFDLEQIYDDFTLYAIFDSSQDYFDFYHLLFVNYKESNDFAEILNTKKYIFYLSRIFIDPEYRGNNDIPQKFKQTLIRCGAKNNIVGCLPYPDQELVAKKPQAQKLLIRYLRKIGLENLYHGEKNKGLIEWNYLSSSTFGARF